MISVNKKKIEKLTLQLFVTPGSQRWDTPRRLCIYMHIMYAYSAAILL